MAQGVSSYVEFAGTGIGGSHTLRINFSETYNQAANTSDLTITSLELKTATMNIGQAFNGNMVISINGTPVITLFEENNSVFLNYQDTFATVYGSGSAVVTGSLNGIAHNANGSKTVSISIAANPDYSIGSPIFWGDATGNMVFTASSQNVALTTIPRQFTLTIGSGTGYTIGVTKNGTPLSNGATITFGDILKISATPASGYAISSLTVNGIAHTNGANVTVAGNVTVAASATASASTVSAPNGTFGTALTLTVTRYNNTYTHTIAYSCAGYTGLIVSNSSATSISWLPPLSLMNGIPSANSATCTLMITTFSGATQIGARSTNITLSVPASVAPTPSIAIVDDTGYASTYGAYVQGKSKLRITVTNGTQYSALAVSRTTTVNGESYTQQTFVTQEIVESGSQNVETTIKDTRGKTGTATATFLALAYAAPEFTAFEVQRCDSGGTPDDTGGYFRVVYRFVTSPLNQRNSRDLKLRYKLTSSSTWTVVTLTTSGYTESGITSPIAVSLDSSYDVSLVMKDDFSEISVSTVLSTTPSTISFKPGGLGVAFGKAAETDNLLDVAWGLRVRGAASFDDRDAAARNIFGGGSTVLNLNTLSSPGAYFAGNGSSNLPYGSYGFVLFFTVTSSGSVGVQIYLPFGAAGSARLYSRFYANNQWYPWTYTTLTA